LLAERRRVVEQITRVKHQLDLPTFHPAREENLISARRAQAVRDYFVQQGVNSASVEAHGYGKTEPIASNDTPEGRQQNRRVELILSGDAIGTDAGGPPPQTASRQ